MSHWPIKTLGELLTTLENGSRPRGGVSEISDGIPSLGGEHINRDGGFVWENPKHVTRDFYTGMKRGRIQHRDILVVKDGATTGKVAVVRDNFPFREAAVNEHVFLLRTDKFKVLPEFVGYFLFGPLGQQQILSNFRGAAIGGIAQDFVRNVHVPVPPLTEQKRIVKLLDEADELRKLRTQADRRTADLIPALFHEMFGDPSENPKGFRKDRLENLIRVTSGNSLPAKDMATGGKFPVYGGNGISGYHNQYMFEQPVIVIGRVGVYCGAVHLSEQKSWVTDNALYICKLKEAFDKQYLVAALRVANLNQYAGRAAQPLVSGNRIYPVPILVPPLPLQQEFAQRVAEIRDMEADQAASRTRLDALFQSLLHRAFASEL